MEINNDVINGIASRLAEEYDSVLILCTKNENCITRAIIRRRGNYFASLGLAKDWIKSEEHQELAKEIAHQTKDE